MKAVYEHYAKDRFNSPPPLEGKGTVKAIHYIISFADSENVTPELAHKLAMTFVRKNFGDEVQAVIATHVDKSHVQNHLIVNSYSLSGQKLYANRDTLRKARENINGICHTFGITPALNFENKGRAVDHYEWEQRKKGTSWKEQIRQAIMEWYFVVWYLCATGARVSKLIRIKIEHVETGYFDLYSKGGKLRRLYIPKKLRNETLEWLKTQERTSGYLFLNRFGERITARGIFQQLKNYAEKYGLDKKVVYPHSFRHRYDILLYFGKKLRKKTD